MKAPIITSSQAHTLHTIRASSLATDLAKIEELRKAEGDDADATLGEICKGLDKTLLGPALDALISRNTTRSVETLIELLDVSVQAPAYHLLIVQVLIRKAETTGTDVNIVDALITHLTKSHISREASKEIVDMLFSPDLKDLVLDRLTEIYSGIDPKYHSLRARLIQFADTHPYEDVALSSLLEQHLKEVEKESRDTTADDSNVETCLIVNALCSKIAALENPADLANRENAVTDYAALNTLVSAYPRIRSIQARLTIIKTLLEAQDADEDFDDDILRIYEQEKELDLKGLIEDAIFKSEDPERILELLKRVDLATHSPALGIKSVNYLIDDDASAEVLIAMREKFSDPVLTHEINEALSAMNNPIAMAHREKA